MLTARGEGTDRVVRLELGADDYLVKPFDPRELVARIHTILRRARTEGSPKKTMMNSATRSVSQDGNSIALRASCLPRTR